jgi:hypothetical protein
VRDQTLHLHIRIVWDMDQPEANRRFHDEYFSLRSVAWIISHNVAWVPLTWHIGALWSESLTLIVKPWDGSNGLSQKGML